MLASSPTTKSAPTTRSVIEWRAGRGDESAPKVFVVENNVARLRPVTLGVRAADRYQVLDGLKSGDLVVSFGQKGLKDGTPVQFK